jgi:hypothetical protein
MFIMICDDARHGREAEDRQGGRSQSGPNQQLLLSFKQYDAEVARHGYGHIREMTTEEIIDAARRGS